MASKGKEGGGREEEIGRGVREGERYKLDLLITLLYCLLQQID